jgi:hypothetical protein
MSTHFFVRMQMIKLWSVFCVVCDEGLNEFKKDVNELSIFSLFHLTGNFHAIQALSTEAEEM